MRRAQLFHATVPAVTTVQAVPKTGKRKSPVRVAIFEAPAAATAQQIELARQVGEHMERARAARGPGPVNELLGPAHHHHSSSDQSDQRPEQQQGASDSAVHSQAGGTQGTQGAAAGLQLLLDGGLPVAQVVADEAMFYDNMEEVFADYEKQRTEQQQRDLEKVRVRRPPGGACRAAVPPEPAVPPVPSPPPSLPPPSLPPPCRVGQGGPRRHGRRRIWQDAEKPGGGGRGPAGRPQ